MAKREKRDLPVVFNNVYLGALGEEVGRRLLENGIEDLSLVPIEEGDRFEVADYQVAGTEVFVDFKYWSVAFQETDTDLLEALRRKLERLGATKLLVCNVLAPGDHGLRCTSLEGGRVLTVPYLIDERTGHINTEALAQVSEWLGR